MIARITITHAKLAAVLAGSMLLGACDRQEGGPILISAIGGSPELRNPSQGPPDAPSSFLAQTTAQGLVRFDASGQIVPALAQRWIVSNDGLRYTFRIAPAEWTNGGKVTAAQVVVRLKLAIAPASRNPLKPILGVVDEIVSMTDDVLEISLKSPRPNFLQLLAQPEMAIVRNGQGSGPYRPSAGEDGSLVLSLPKRRDDDNDELPPPNLHLRGERAELAVVHFRSGRAHYVTGGTADDLPIARAARLTPQVIRFDPVAGLFGLLFANNTGPLSDPMLRDALSMAIDRETLVAGLGVPGLQPRASLLPPGTADVPQPAAPAWTAQPLAERRKQAADAIARVAGDLPIELRVAVPAGPGYRVLFAHLRSDWRRIGVTARAVGPREAADLRLVDEVAPVAMASWYMRHFTCAAGRVCSSEADQALDAARIAATREERSQQLSQADLLLRDVTPFIPLTAPVRWSLVSPRLTGFQPSVFALHAADELVVPQR